MKEGWIIFPRFYFFSFQKATTQLSINEIILFHRSNFSERTDITKKISKNKKKWKDRKLEAYSRKNLHILLFTFNHSQKRRKEPKKYVQVRNRIHSFKSEKNDTPENGDVSAENESRRKRTMLTRNWHISAERKSGVVKR